MRWTIKTVLFLSILIGLLNSSVAADVDMKFRRISPPGGLNFQSLNHIAQDSTGNIWISSNQGIYKYNSNGFVRYSHNPLDSTSLREDIVLKIVVDQLNNLWILTSTGLDFYDNETQKFRHVIYFNNQKAVPNQRINDLAFDSKGRLWMTDSNGLGILNVHNNSIDYRVESIGNIRPLYFYLESDNQVWVGMSNGSVHLYNHQVKHLTQITEELGSSVRALLVDNKSVVVGYRSSGLRKYDRTGKLLKKYDIDAQYDITKTNVRSLLKDKRGNLWIGTYLGLYLDNGDSTFRVEPFFDNEFRTNSIYSIFQDRSDGIWLSTWSGGLFYKHTGDNQFLHYQHDKNRSSLSNNIVSSFVQDGDNSLYIGTEVGGLNRFDIEQKKFERIDLKKNSKVTNVKSLCVDFSGTIWAGTFMDGLWYKKKGRAGFRSADELIVNDFSSSNQLIYDLEPDSEGLWVVTYGSGIFYFNYETKEMNAFSAFVDDVNDLGWMGQARDVYIDDQKRLWIAHRNGVACFTPLKEQGRYKLTMREDIGEVYYVNVVYDNEIWFGTKSKGIFSYSNNKLSVNEKTKFLIGNDVYGFVTDVDKNIWVTSNDGLFLVRPEKWEVQQFTLIDGIQGNQFNPKALFKDSNHNLYFGGTNGFTVSAKGRLNFNDRAPVVGIDKVTVNNQHDIPAIYNTFSNAFKPITLSHDENSLKILFSADSYLHPQKNKYQYRLIGIFDEWVENGNNTSAIFTNLPSGEYVFEVKACNNNEVWNNTPTILNIEIKYPWWKTIWAYLGYFMVLAIIAYVLSAIRMERLVLKKVIADEKRKREQDVHLHEMKLKFFTNISHEIRTPLTLIAGPLSSILRDNSLSLGSRNKVLQIQRNTNRLLLLINQILDFRKIEKGHRPVVVNQFLLSGFLNECYSYFSEEANEKVIEFTCEIENDININLDEEKLQKIVTNLLSNAFKYTPKGGKITIKSTQGRSTNLANYDGYFSIGNKELEDCFTISITDTGKGIDNENLNTIFDRFDKGKSNDFGTGIGLSICREFTILLDGALYVSSTVGKGTCFDLILPTSLMDEKHSVVNEKMDEMIMIQSMEAGNTNFEPILQKNGNKFKVLVVDDNMEMRNFIGGVLRDYFVVDEAANGEIAFHKMKFESYHLVVSDVMMPKMNGYELCEKIKGNDELKQIPVILVSALSTTDNEITGLNVGADDYITKPFDEKVLLKRAFGLLVKNEQINILYESKLKENGVFIFSDQGENFFIERVNSIIYENLNNPQFSVEKLSDDLGMSRGHLHRKLKQLTSNSPNEYIRIIRLKKAKELMKQSEFNIEEISYKVGFNSASYFIKCFRLQYDETPKEYMLKMNNRSK